MRITEEISEEEYSKKKNELLKEKKKYEELLSDSHQRVETWLDRADALFNFAETAKTQFLEGPPAKRRQILSCLGSNLILDDKKITVKGNNKIMILKDLAPEVRKIHSTLEPIKSHSIQAVWDENLTKNHKWGE